MGQNTFKSGIASGQTQFGLWSSMCSHISAEIAAHAGYDWILFDAEHSPLELADLYGLLQAVAQGSSHGAVRLAWNDTVLIKRALDIGAQTIMVPFVQNANEAQAAARACAYPPHGVRGVAGSTRASRYGRDKSYLSTARDQICLIVQVETSEALGALKDIATVEGVDGVFIGPSDLAASMGHLGNPGHPDVQAALRSAASRLADIGVPSGILAVTEADAKRYADWGYSFVAAGVDTGLFVAAIDQRIAALKG